MKEITNRFVQEQIKNSGEGTKVCWSMLWQYKELYLSDILKKGYKENTARIALAKFVAKGWAEKPKGTRNYWVLSKKVVKG